MTRLNDPDVVEREYATECGLEGRRSAYRWAEGPDAPDMAFRAVAETAPGAVLEVGCGPGDLAARIATELPTRVTALDISPRMVELAREKGIDASVGDVQDIPFWDGSFDVAVAAWVLYHVPDVDRGLAELARVLRPGGRLVAVTNGLDHLQELRQLAGLAERPREVAFSAENGNELLRRHFDRVEARDAAGTIRFPDRESVQAYLDASTMLDGPAEHRPLPEVETPFIVRRAPVVFVAEKAP